MLTALVLLAAIMLGHAGHTSGAEQPAQNIGKLSLETPPATDPDLVQIGFHDLGGGGFNGDIWLHGDFVYVGAFWTGSGACPALEVKVVDVSDPFNPTPANTLSLSTGSRANDVKVAAVSTGSFQGDLLVNSNEVCAGGGSHGVQLWDVTDPRNAVELSYFHTGSVHNTYLYQKGDRAYVLLAVPFAELSGTSSDLQIIDVTDPANPVLAGEWTVGRDAGLAYGFPGASGAGDCTPPPNTLDLCRGDSALVYLHDVWVSSDGTIAYLSYWDAGLITLDISDPTSPTLIAVATEPLDEEGNAHNAVPDETAGLILVADEDFAPAPWGFLRILDNTNPSNPVQVGTFATPNALAATPPNDGWYTVHNLIVEGGLAYLAWYSDGVRVLDLADPTTPREIASFVPPDVADPHGQLPARSLVWGVSLQDGIIYAIDINGGLYVLAFDSDWDGCADVQELGSNAALGGQRDPLNFWDFVDQWVGVPPEKNGTVTVGDMGAVVARFGTFQDPILTEKEALAEALTPPVAVTGYHASADRSGSAGPDPWDLLPPNGTITVGDLGVVVAQFGHTCA